MCAQYPEVLQARIAFELALEKQALENAINPTTELKDRIFERIGSTGKIVPLQDTSIKNTQPGALLWLKYAAAACVVLLAGSLYMNITLSNKNKKLKGSYDNTLAELNEVKKDIRVLQQNPNIKMASMKGMDISPKSYATVYWDTASHDVYLLANNLPAPPNDKQYQLWALLDGKPIRYKRCYSSFGSIVG